MLSQTEKGVAHYCSQCSRSDQGSGRERPAVHVSSHGKTSSRSIATRGMRVASLATMGLGYLTCQPSIPPRTGFLPIVAESSTSKRHDTDTDKTQVRTTTCTGQRTSCTLLKAGNNAVHTQGLVSRWDSRTTDGLICFSNTSNDLIQRWAMSPVARCSNQAPH
jgi:hypothetical protein